MGCGGYLAKRGSSCDLRQSRNCEPRADVIRRIHEQEWQSEMALFNRIRQAGSLPHGLLLWRGFGDLAD
jgi:hypothetical protein